MITGLSGRDFYPSAMFCQIAPSINNLVWFLPASAPDPAVFVRALVL
jgi:hypothetical protein